MEVLAKVWSMKSYHRFGGFSEEEKNKRGLVREEKCSNYVTEDWSLKRVSWWIILASRAIEGVLRKGLYNNSVLKCFLCDFVL